MNCTKKRASVKYPCFYEKVSMFETVRAHKGYRKLSGEQTKKMKFKFILKFKIKILSLNSLQGEPSN